MELTICGAAPALFVSWWSRGSQIISRSLSSASRAFLVKYVLTLLLLASGASPGSAQADTSNPARVAIHALAPKPVGHLILGASTPEDAARILKAHGGLGPARENQVTFRIAAATLRPGVLYTPPATMHQLYFDKDTLVLVVAGVPRDLPTTQPEFMARFPTARETQRESGWYELQTALSTCVWLIAVFDTRTDGLESIGYAYSCSPQ